MIVLFGVGCEDKVQPSVTAIPHETLPSQESWNSTVTFSDSARVKAVLWAGHIVSYASQQQTLLSDSVRVDFYNDAEQHTSLLTAHRGRVNDQTQDFAAYTNVVVISDSGTILKTDSLFWKNSDRKILTEAFVEILSKTERIMGHGLVSDQALKNYRITRVTGQTVSKE